MKTALFVATIILFNQAALTAQIEKGVTSLGGTASFENFKSNSLFSSPNYNTFNLSPTYGRFITDKIMIKGSIGISTLNSRKDYYNFKQYDITIEVRYYFNRESTLKFFAGASVGLRTFTHSQGSFLSSRYSKFTNHDFHQSVYGGFNYFLNKEIALEGTLGVSHANISEGLFTRNLTNVYNTSINLSLNNFVNFKSSDKDFEGLISKGRTIIGGNFSLNRYSGKSYDYGLNSTYKQRGNYATLEAEYGKIVVNGLLIGARVNGVLGDNAKQFTVTPYAQYFYSVSKRLKVHAKAEFGYNISKYTNSTTIKGGIGATYFLSKNVALNVDILNFSKTIFSNSTLKSNTTGSNIGLRFFLK